MALPYPTKVVLPFDIATAQDMNERHANDVALANGSGLDDGAVTADKLDFSTIKTTHVVSHVFPAGTGTRAITGFGFKPTSIIVQTRTTAGSTAFATDGSAYDTGGGIENSAVCSQSSSGVTRTDIAAADCFYLASSGGGSTFRGAVTSFDADGITVNVAEDNSSGPGPRSWNIIAFR